METSIATAADSNIIKDLLLLLYSLYHKEVKYPIYIYDIGLTEENKEHILKTGCDVKIIKPEKQVSHFVSANLGKWEEDKDVKVYFKPFIVRDLIERTNDTVIFLDADTVVLDPSKLYFMSKIASHKMVLTHDGWRQYPRTQYPVDLTTYIGKPLWDMFPFTYPHEKVFINSGVFAISPESSMDILERWCELCEISEANEEIDRYVGFSDQGCLRWSLQYFPSNKFIVLPASFNRGVNRQDKEVFSDSKDIEEVVRKIRAATPQSVGIIHLFGVDKLGKSLKFSEEDMLKYFNKETCKNRKFVF